MKRRNEAGFSLVEVLVAITILAAVVLPICSALVLSVRMNERTDELMRAQLAVSSAVETLMAEGISVGDTFPEDYGNDGTFDRFPDVKIAVAQATKDGDDTVTLPYYNVTVASNDGLVTVTTTVASVPVSADNAQTESTTDPSTDPSTEPTGEEGSE